MNAESNPEQLPRVVSTEFARTYRVIPVFNDTGGVTYVLAEAPLSADDEQRLSFFAGMTIRCLPPETIEKNRQHFHKLLEAYCDHNACAQGLTDGLHQI